MELTYKRCVYILILFSVFLKLFLGSNLEFGNDEVYYWLYAKYPDISHFDHPPMVGFFIQLFTLNLTFDSEVFIRLAAIIPSAISVYIIFLIGTFLKSEKAGFIASLLYSISIYGFIIAGTFILPDAPLVLFWLLSFYFFIQTVPFDPNPKFNTRILLAFLFAGLAIYSKYQAVYLLLGIVLFVFLKNRRWLRSSVFYIGFIFPLLAIGLIFYWNYSNDFISYKFHGGRVSFFSFTFNKNSFTREVLGQILYNNPYNVIMLIVMFVAIKRKQFKINTNITTLFLFCALPLIFTTIYLSISRNTLPHWSGIAYLTLIPLLGVYLSENKKRIVGKLEIGVLAFSFLLVTAVFVINEGWFLPVDTEEQKEKLGRKNALLDMYGWKQASQKISDILKEEKLTHLSIISNRWYPAAHVDYYIARPNNMNVYGVGSLNDIHKYYWINSNHPEVTSEVLYITDSRNFKAPSELFAKKYHTFNLIKTIPIERNREVVKYVFLYKLSKE